MKYAIEVRGWCEKARIQSRDIETKEWICIPGYVYGSLVEAEQVTRKPPYTNHKKRYWILANTSSNGGFLLHRSRYYIKDPNTLEICVGYKDNGEKIFTSIWNLKGEENK